MILDKINCPDDLDNLSTEELSALSQEIRQCLIQKLSKTGGHVGSNLGVVELTVALHKVVQSTVDKILFDHIHYVTGYSNPKESEHDFFPMGHTSTAISLAAGFMKSRDLR